MESAASNYQRQLIYQSPEARRGTVKWLTVYRHSNLEAAKRSKTVANLRVKPRLTWYNYEIQKPLRKIYGLYFSFWNRSPSNGENTTDTIDCVSLASQIVLYSRLVIFEHKDKYSLRMKLESSRSNGFIIAANKFFGLTTLIGEPWHSKQDHRSHHPESM